METRCIYGNAARHRRLGRDFFARGVLDVAKELVGAVLVHDDGRRVLAGRVVETEAYRGPEDRAAHSYGGRRTPRTEVMFGRAGHAYLFFVYGKHWNFNVVTGQPDEPQAVLIRAVEPVVGQALMATRRGRPEESLELTNGPGKLCQAFGFDRRSYGLDLCRGAIFFVEGAPTRVLRSARIGVDYAGSWAQRPWRFFEADSPWVSRCPRPRGRLGRQ